jgi:hypothetical protein
MVDGPGLEPGASSMECEDDDGGEDDDENKGGFERRDVVDCVVEDGSPELVDVEEEDANDGPYS